MKITPRYANDWYSIRFVEFIKNDGHLVDSYFELICNPFKCIGIFNHIEDAKAEMERLSKLHTRRPVDDSRMWRNLSGQGV